MHTYVRTHSHLHAHTDRQTDRQTHAHTHVDSDTNRLMGGLGFTNSSAPCCEVPSLSPSLAEGEGRKEEAVVTNAHTYVKFQCKPMQEWTMEAAGNTFWLPVIGCTFLVPPTG